MGDDDVKDGMDLVLCRITPAPHSSVECGGGDSKEKKWEMLEFAGAHNPLYLIRDKKIIEINGDTIWIGSTTRGNNSKFKNHEIKLMKDDILYLFSDGYPDQKGGAENKKFYYAPFRELLLKVHQLPMEEQSKQLDKAITQWKGDNDQIDDILIFGVKI